MNLKQSARITATAFSVVAGSVLVSAAGPAVAGEILVAASKKQAPTYSPEVINRARIANQARAGNDDDWDKCMAEAPGDFVEKLGICFCLTTPDAPCGADGSFD